MATEDPAHLGLMLCRLFPMEQAAASDGELLDLLPSFDDGRAPPEVDIGGCEVAQAFVVSAIVVMLDEGADLAFKVSRQVIVFQQDAVLERLMPTLDLALGLGMIRRTTNMTHAALLQPVRKIAGDVRRAIVAEQPGFVD